MATRFHFIIIASLLGLAVCLNACSHSNPNSTALNYVTVQLQPNTTTLYFSGTVQPAKVYTVASPVDGTIAQKYIDYGASVNKNQLLLVLNSNQLQLDYQNALADYLKAKRQYNNTQVQMQGIDLLKKLGIISQDEYLNDKNNSYDTALAYTQATNKLANLLSKAGTNIDSLKNLELSDTAAVNQALLRPLDALPIRAPASGIVLIPPKADTNSNDDATTPALNIGNQVKAQQPLLAIGDMTGISLTIKVSEIHVNNIVLGQKALITGDGFPNITLNGQVTHINQQASASNDGSTPSFPVTVTVPTLTDAQRKLIHVGMSANIQLQVVQPPSIIIPLSAVISKNNNSIVEVIDPESGKITARPVTTGATTLDSVAITQGLKPGEKIVANPTSTN